MGEVREVKEDTRFFSRIWQLLLSFAFWAFQAVFYYVGHTAVIYDVDTHRQRLLQGHVCDLWKCFVLWKFHCEMPAELFIEAFFSNMPFSHNNQKDSPPIFQQKSKDQHPPCALT